MYKVLVTAQLHPIALELMKREGLELDVKPLLPKEEIIKIISSYHGIVTRSDTAVDKDILDKGTSLKVVGRAAIGIDNIDVEHATRRGILVVHVPAARWSRHASMSGRSHSRIRLSLRSTTGWGKSGYRFR